MGRPIKHEQELGTEPIDGTLLRRNASKVKSSPSAPLLNTTHPRRHRDRHGHPRIERRDPNLNPASSGGKKDIRSTSRVRPCALAGSLVYDVTVAPVSGPSLGWKSEARRRKTGGKLVVHFTTCCPQPPGNSQVLYGLSVKSSPVPDLWRYSVARETRAGVRRHGRSWGTGFPLQAILCSPPWSMKCWL